MFSYAWHVMSMAAIVGRLAGYSAACASISSVHTGQIHLSIAAATAGSLAHAAGCTTAEDIR